MRLYGILLAVLLTVGCTTETTSKTSNFEGSESIRRDTDPEKKAASRVDAAQQYLRINNLERAKYHLDRAAEHDKNYPDLHFILGFYYQMARDFNLAEKSFARALELDSRNAEYKNGFGQFLCSVGQYARAHQYFQQAIDTPTYSNTAQVFVNAGLCRKAEGNNNDAVEYFARALNINSKLPTALVELADHEFNQQRYARAKSYIERYREVAPHIPRTLWIILRAESKLGNKDAVASYALQLEQLFPDAEETLQFLDNRDKWQ